MNRIQIAKMHAISMFFTGNVFSLFDVIAIILRAHVCSITYSNYPLLHDHLAINYFLL